jgi:oligopeptidase A
MENFCYDKTTLYGFAKHWETGDPMPEEMFKKLVEQKTFNAGMMACRQLLFGQIDLTLHSDYDPIAGENGEGESIFDVHRRMAEKYTPYSMPLPEDRFLCTFSHIFAGGKDKAHDRPVKELWQLCCTLTTLAFCSKTGELTLT